MKLEDLKKILATDAEIARAQEAIDADGPMAAVTIELGRLTVFNPHLKGFLERSSNAAASDAPAWPEYSAGMPPAIFWRAAMAGALIYGLNLGLRIAAERVDAVKEKR